MEETIETLRAELMVSNESRKKLEDEKIKLANENVNLVNRILGMKQEIAEKINEASTIYNEGLQLMQKSQITHESNIMKQFEQTKEESLEEFMVGTAMAPVVSQIPEKPKYKLAAHKNEALAVRYDPLGNTLATAGGDGYVKIYDPTKGKEIMSFKEFTKPVTCLEYNLEGTLICAGSVDGQVKLLDMKTQRSKHSFTGHKETVNALSMMLRSPKVISGSSDRTIRIWDYAKLQIIGSVFFLNAY